MKTDNTTKILLLMIAGFLAIMAFRPFISPSHVDASPGSYDNLKYLGSTAAYSLWLDTKTGEIWMVHWDNFPELVWTKGGRFIDFGQPLAK
jgi:hypothetical protein